jgi:hypothetical protein
MSSELLLPDAPYHLQQMACPHSCNLAISPAGASHIHRLLGCCMQKGKLRRRKDAEAQAEEFQKLTDDEKSDLVSQAIEALQAEIEQVGPPLSSMCKVLLGMWWNRGC